MKYVLSILSLAIAVNVAHAQENAPKIHKKTCYRLGVSAQVAVLITGNADSAVAYCKSTNGSKWLEIGGAVGYGPSFLVSGMAGLYIAKDIAPDPNSVVSGETYASGYTGIGAYVAAQIENNWYRVYGSSAEDALNSWRYGAKIGAGGGIAGADEKTTFGPGGISSTGVLSGYAQMYGGNIRIIPLRGVDPEKIEVAPIETIIPAPIL